MEDCQRNIPSININGELTKHQKSDSEQYINESLKTKSTNKDTLNSLVEDAFDRISDGIVALDNNWCYNYLNQPAAEMLQRKTPAELLGKNIWREFPEGVGQPFYHAYIKAFETQLPIIFEEHYQPWDLWFENRIYPSKNGLTIYFTNITERKKNEAKMVKMAHFDSLTDLPNRVMLTLRLEHALQVAKREKRIFALLMLDLDHFKNVNDSFGHAVGDLLLIKVAATLQKRFRNVDTVSRLGGDEFTILLEDLEQREDAAKIAFEIIELVKQPWRLKNDIEVRIGASIGISLYPEHGQCAEELLQYADTSLYEAKAAGRGEYKYYSNELTIKVRTRIELETKLRAAIINNELVVHFQPQIDIRSNLIIGAEALVRWYDPKVGLIFPDQFIPIAESTGLIVEIGNIVLRETCLQGRRWLDAGYPPLCLAVNLSPHQFLHSDIVNVVTNTLQKTGFPAKHLELEITESALMERESEAIEILEHLREIGIRIAIDDFGTGYSSLSYLKKLPIDVLKIDKSFIDDIPNSQDDMAIAATIIAMAKILKLQVLAEGVETEQQLAFLEKEQCDLFQGYLFSPAISGEEFEALLILKQQ